MKKTDILNLLYELASPLALVLAGLILVFCPDAATILISRLLGWILTLVGIGFGIGAILNHSKAISRGITSVGLVCIGGFLSANPLLLASFAGRVVGLLLLLDGIADLVNAHRRGIRGLMPLLVTMLGGILVLMPMTASRLVFGLCGLVVTIVGIFMLLDRLRHRRLPRGNDDPNIIDAL